MTKWTAATVIFLLMAWTGVGLVHAQTGGPPQGSQTVAQMAKSLLIINKAGYDDQESAAQLESFLSLLRDYLGREESYQGTYSANAVVSNYVHFSVEKGGLLRARLVRYTAPRELVGGFGRTWVFVQYRDERDLIRVQEIAQASPEIPLDFIVVKHAGGTRLAVAGNLTYYSPTYTPSAAYVETFDLRNSEWKPVKLNSASGSSRAFTVTTKGNLAIIETPDYGDVQVTTDEAHKAFRFSSVGSIGASLPLFYDVDHNVLACGGTSD